jgi:hypothetical protein
LIIFDRAKANAEKKRQISQKPEIFMTLPESIAGAPVLS